MKARFLAVVALAAAGACADLDDSAPGDETLGADEAAVTAEVPRDPSRHSILFEEETVIRAPLADVWNLLVDIDGYGDWNPWIVWAEGDAVPGAVVHADVVMNGGDVMEVEHVVLAVDAEQRFCWRDSGPSTLFVYGQRCRWLTPGRDPGTVHFRQQLLLEGVFAPVAKLIYGGALRAGMVAETAALRSTAEAL